MNEKLEKLNRELAKGEARLRRAQHEQKILEHQMKQLKGHNLVQAFPVNVGMLDKMLILDIVLDDFLIHAVCVCRFRSFPFRLCRFFPQRRGVRGKDRNGMVI